MIILNRNIGDSPLEEMMLICKYIEDFNMERLLCALNERGCDEGEVRSITADINLQNAKLVKQKVHLENYSHYFNKEYANDDNKHFDTAEKTSRKMRSGLKGCRDLLKRFSPKICRRNAPNERALQAHVHSSLSRSNYQLQLFGLEQYPDCVKELLSCIIGFFNNVNDCICICKDVIRDEKRISKSKKACYQLFIDACEKAHRNLYVVIEAMKTSDGLRQAMIGDASLNDDTENKILKKHSEFNSDEDFAQYGFHKYTQRDIDKLVLVKTLKECDKDKLSMTEVMLFKDNKQFVNDIRYIISNFDILLENKNVKCKRNTIPALAMCAFMEWTKTTRGVKLFLTYFSDMYSDNGKYSVPKESAISGAKRNNIKNNDIKLLKQDLDSAITTLLAERDQKAKFAANTKGKI